MGDKKFGVAIIGAKFAAGLHAEAYKRLPGVEIKAVADINPEAVLGFAKKYGIKKTFTDYKEMIKLPEVDLVSICAPNFLHKDLGVEIAKAGKPMICEKPLATTLEDGRTLINTVEKHKVKLYYAEDWIFAPALKRAKAIYEEGAIGEVLFLKAKETHSGTHSPFAQKKKTCGGGAMIHLGVHPVGWARWFKGKEVVEVTAKTSGGGNTNLKHKKYEGEDWACGILKFSDGAFALVEGNYITVGGLDDIVELYGTKGVVKVNLSQGSPVSAFSLDGMSYAIEKAEMTSGWTRPAVDEENELGYVSEIGHFVDSAMKNKDSVPGSNGIDGLKTLEIIDAIYRSSETGRAVKL